MSSDPPTSSPAFRLVGLGELLWDEFADGRRPGGAPANVAYHAMMLGLHGQVASRVGRDEDGDRLVNEIAQTGFDVSLVQIDPEHDTGRVTVDLEDGEPSYAIHPAAWDHLEATPELLAACQSADAVCFGTLAQRADASRSTIQECLDGGTALKVYDVNLRQSFYTKETISDSLQKANIVKLNTDETLLLAKQFGLPKDDGFGPALRDRFGLDLVCITHGGDGCELIADSRVREQSEPVDVADAVGAGDSFTAALTYATLHDWPLPERARLANGVGGIVASSRGAMPAIGDRVAALRDEIRGR